MASAMLEDTNMEDDQLASMSTDDIARASRLLDNEIRILKVEISNSCLIQCIASLFSCLLLLNCL